MRSRIISAAAVLLLAWVGACSDTPGPASADDALTRLRDAVADRDGAEIYRLYDAESRGYYRDQVRSWRAAVARGEPVGEVLPASLEWDRDRLMAGSDEEATTRLLGRHSSFALLGDWFQQAVVVGRDESAPGEMRLELEGPDGQVRAIWFVREPDGWAYDHYRSRW